MQTSADHKTDAAERDDLKLYKLEAILHDADMVVVIVAEPDSPYFSLVDIDAKIRPGRFVGVVGLIGGAPVVSLEEPLEPETFNALAAACVLHVLSRFQVSTETRH